MVVISANLDLSCEHETEIGPQYEAMCPRDNQANGSKSDDLFRLILESDWDGAKEELKHNAHAASQWMTKLDADAMICADENRWRRLPLHEACIRQPSVGFVDALLEAYPSSVSEVDHNLKLPLHHACYHGASVHVVTRLLMHYPESVDAEDCWGKTPLRVVESSSNFVCNSSKAAVIDTLSKGSKYYLIEGVKFKMEQEARKRQEKMREEIMSYQKHIERIEDEKGGYLKEIVNLKTEIDSYQKQMKRMEEKAHMYVRKIECMEKAKREERRLFAERDSEAKYKEVSNLKEKLEKANESVRFLTSEMRAAQVRSKKERNLFETEKLALKDHIENMKKTIEKGGASSTGQQSGVKMRNMEKKLNAANTRVASLTREVENVKDTATQDKFKLHMQVRMYKHQLSQLQKAIDEERVGEKSIRFGAEAIDVKTKLEGAKDFAKAMNTEGRQLGNAAGAGTRQFDKGSHNCDGEAKRLKQIVAQGRNEAAQLESPQWQSSIEEWKLKGELKRGEMAVRVLESYVAKAKRKATDERIALEQEKKKYKELVGLLKKTVENIRRQSSVRKIAMEEELTNAHALVKKHKTNSSEPLLQLRSNAEKREEDDEGKDSEDSVEKCYQAAISTRTELMEKERVEQDTPIKKAECQPLNTLATIETLKCDKPIELLRRDSKAFEVISDSLRDSEEEHCESQIEEPEDVDQKESIEQRALTNEEKKDLSMTEKEKKNLGSPVEEGKRTVSRLMSEMLEMIKNAEKERDYFAHEKMRLMNELKSTRDRMENKEKELSMPLVGWYGSFASTRCTSWSPMVYRRPSWSPMGYRRPSWSPAG